MQSGITASKELHDAFNTLILSHPSQRGLLACIKNEQLVPVDIITSSSVDFFEDLSPLQSLIKDDEAAYIILRRYQNAPDGFVAVTYVPDTANVRQKMLFASTRLTLVRELGTERFRETLFATTKQELTAEGWRKHDESGESNAPLTDEEQSLRGVKEAEAEASQGMSARISHVDAGHIKYQMSTNALEALRNLPTSHDNLVQLSIDVRREVFELVGTSSTSIDDLSTTLSEREPRFSCFRYTHQHEGQTQSPVIFIYTCPPGTKIKDRMVYALSRNGFVHAMGGSDIGLEISRKLEMSSPSEITATTIHEELHPKQAHQRAFPRPKRPGKR